MVLQVAQASRMMGIRARYGLDSVGLSCTGHRYRHVFGLCFLIVPSFEGWRIMSMALLSGRRVERSKHNSEYISDFITRVNSKHLQGLVLPLVMSRTQCQQ
jgi:hypothetical protein